MGVVGYHAFLFDLGLLSSVYVKYSHGSQPGDLSKLLRGPQDDLNIFKIRQNKQQNQEISHFNSPLNNLFSPLKNQDSQCVFLT